MYTLTALKVMPYPLAPLLIETGLATIELRGLLIGLNESSTLLPEDVSNDPPKQRGNSNPLIKHNFIEVYILPGVGGDTMMSRSEMEPTVSLLKSSDLAFLLRELELKLEVKGEI